MKEIYVILFSSGLKIGDTYLFEPQDFNLSLGKRVYYYFNVEKLPIEALRDTDIMKIVLDCNYKIIDIYKYSMEELNKYIVLL